MLGTLALAAVAAAQDARPSRPRIGLALGGGSARGLAHVGVLEWFEQRRIPIDVIGGTSIGGLVAGAYATGLTPSEIRAILRAADWDAILLTETPFAYKTFRRKEDARAYPAPIELGLRHGIRFPGGLNPGQQIQSLLDSITLPVGELASFDDLPTPFRCVATDLRAAEARVLDHGSLAAALRATMAIPGVFTPAEIDGRLLVDGGMVNNVPADVVRAMGADVVIAVDVRDDSPPEAMTETVFGILSESVNTVMLSNVKRSLASADHIIDPDLRGMGLMDFRKGDELAARGYTAAKAAAALEQYAIGEEAYAAYLAARRARRPAGPIIPAFVRVEGVSGKELAGIERQFAGEIARPLEPARLAETVQWIAGSDRYETITYRLVRGDAGTGLLVSVRPKPYGPPFLRASVDLANTSSTTFALTARARVTNFDITGYGSELRTEAALGSRPGASMELYHPIRGSRLFVAPRVWTERQQLTSYTDGVFSSDYRLQRAGIGADVVFGSGYWTEVRLGYHVAGVRGRYQVGQSDVPEVTGLDRFARLGFVLDRHDSAVIPTVGTRVQLDLAHHFHSPETQVGGPSAPREHSGQFDSAEIGLSFVHSPGRRNRVLVMAGGGTHFGERPLVDRFAIGGFSQLGAYNQNEFTGAAYLRASVGYLRQVGRLPDMFGGPVHLGGWFESGSAFSKLSTAQFRSDVAAGLVLESLVGPAFVGGSVSANGRYRIYILLGRIF